MDWLRLFALLIAVASVQIRAEGPKKKIRIHLPQKVKHIHHHKKIYITNHPAAASQYAPAYLPSGEGAVALPSNMGLPGILPFNSMELYEDGPSRYPGGLAAPSKLLPLYRARGYYGPTPSEVEEQEYDLAPPPEPVEESYRTNDYAPPPPPAPSRLKIIKVKEGPRKKVNKKQKPKRAPVRSRPRPEPEDEHPVSNFHEQFYSDVDGTATIRKIKKPPRVEKIVDGDTEHIHTYSEEHIHKLVFDEDSKVPGLVGVDPMGSMSALSAVRPFPMPLHNQHLLALPPDTLTGFAAVASPSHLDYAAYNPRDVTHDHIFHDHGEIPADVDLDKEALGLPPKISYNSQGLRITGSHPKRLKSKYTNKFPKPTKPTPVTDFSYYENMYTPNSGLKKLQRPKLSHYGAAPEPTIDDYRPIPSFKLLGKHKPRSYGGNAVSEFRQTSAPSPFAVSSTIVHDYQPKAFPGAPPSTGFSKFKDPFVNYEENYPNNYEFDTFASSSNVHSSDRITHPGTKTKKKSVSTQNINFGGKGHETSIDHLEENVMASEINDDDTPTALDNFSSYDDSRPPNSVTSTPYTIKETSPVHQYYTAMAVKAMQNEQASEASNDNFQYVEAPPQTTPSSQSEAATTNAPSQYVEMSNRNPVTTEPPEYPSEKRQRGKSLSKLNSEQDHRQRYSVIMDYKSDDRPNLRPQAHPVKFLQNPVSDANIRGQLKYGDKI